MTTRLTMQIFLTRDGYAWKVMTDGDGRAVHAESPKTLETMDDAFCQAGIFTSGLLQGLEKGRTDATTKTP